MFGAISYFLDTGIYQGVPVLENGDVIKKPGCMYSNLIPSSNWDMDPAILNYRCLAPIPVFQS